MVIAVNSTSKTDELLRRTVFERLDLRRYVEIHWHKDVGKCLICKEVNVGTLRADE